jgi:hypothetical protein
MTTAAAIISEKSNNRQIFGHLIGTENKYIAYLSTHQVSLMSSNTTEL